MINDVNQNRRTEIITAYMKKHKTIMGEYPDADDLVFIFGISTEEANQIIAGLPIDTDNPSSG